MSTTLSLVPQSHQERDQLHQLGEDIAELSANIDAATYRLLTMIRQFDEELGWDPTAFSSCSHWLAWRCGLHLGVAREKVRVARALEALPLIAEGLRLGELSYSKARAMTRVATPDSEELLVEQARKMTASQLELLTRSWRVVTGDTEARETKQRDQSRSLSMQSSDDGMVHIRGRLTHEQAALLTKALEIAEDALYKDNPAAADPMSEHFTEKTQRSADALALVAETSLQHASQGQTTDDRFQVVVHVDEAPLSRRECDGQSYIQGTGRVSAETSRRLGCNGSRVTMTHNSEGAVLDVGRKSRVAPTALQRAVVHRDRCCQFPGCQVKFCELHHVKHWAEGGETKLFNLLLLCKRHHYAVHEGGYRIEWDEGVRFFTPHGTPMDPPMPTGDVSAETLLRDNQKAGINVDHTTGGALGTGESCNMGWVVHVLAHNFHLERSRPGD